jgi:hypothetical protein
MKSTAGMILALGALTMACSHAEQRPAEVATAGCAQLEPGHAEKTFYKPGQVYAARPVKERQVIARAHQPERTVGAELYMHAQPGLTQEYLQRSLACHSVAGRPAHPNDPLHLANGSLKRLTVRSVGSNFVVKAIGDSPQAGREIWQRARSFTAPGSEVTAEQLATANVPSPNN